MPARTRFVFALILIAASLPLPQTQPRAQAQRSALTPAAPPRVRGLIVYHYSGQTFLRWESSGTNIRRYYVYRSRRPLRTALALRQAEQRYEVQPGSAVNRRLSDALQRPLFYRIPGPHGALDGTRECFVVTATEPGRWYYAVTASGPEGEFRQVRPGRNAVRSAVREHVAVPAAVHQGRFTHDGEVVDVFTHWTTDRDIPGYPAMSTISCQAFNFAVQKNGKADIHPLQLRLHGRGDHFLNNSNGNQNPQEYILALDDALAASNVPTFWFGYDRGVDVARRGGPSGAAPGAGVSDFTMRRIRWTLDWALRKLPVDSTRVFVTGSSMGGSGAAFSLLEFGDRFAAARAMIPRLDYAYIDSTETPQGRSAPRLFRTLWGAPERAPRMADGRAVYDVLDFAKRLGGSGLRSFPPLQVISGRGDSVVGWRQALPSMRAADSLASGIAFFWDERGHSTSSRHPWSPQQHAVDLARYRNNRSWPAFSRVSANADTERDRIGSMNAAVTWFEPVIDESDRWSVGIARATLEMRDSLYIAKGPLTADIGPRRLQRFRIHRGQWYAWTLTVGNTQAAAGTQRAVHDGELIIPSVPIPERRARLEIRPVAGPIFNR